MGDNSIKSVRRVFEILELFDEERQPLGAKRISRQLNYPLTSAHALLKSMHDLGYADYDAPTWTYMPSSRLCGIVDWVRDTLDRESQLLDFISALNEETQETINLSRPQGSNAKIIHGLECTYAFGVSVKVGTVMPITQSLTGMTALSSLDDADLQAFLDRLKTDDADQYQNLNRKVLKKTINEVRDRGTVAGCNNFVQGIGAVCVPVYSADKDNILVIGVVGPSDRIMEHQARHRRSIKSLATRMGIRTVYPVRNPRK